MQLRRTFLTSVSLAFVLPLFLLSSPKKKTKLFLPNRKTEWHTFLNGSGKNNDPNNVFVFEGDVLHVSGNGFGYISTEKNYSDFHFTVEFKWGENRYPPRENAKRDAGIMYHVILYNGDKVWPRSLEYQVQEGDCGDFWMTDSTTIHHADSITTAVKSLRIIKSKDAEKPKGEWNKAEVIVKNGRITHLLNGEIVNEGGLGNTKTGNILLQSEGAEVYYRNAVVEEL
jgi:hypothetical protein